MKNRDKSVPGQMSIFDFSYEKAQENVAMSTKKEMEKPNVCTNERLQELFGNAIKIVNDMGFPLEKIDPYCYVKDFKKKWACCAYKNQVNTITVAKTLLTASEFDIMNTLIHEVLHATKGGHSHKGSWKARAAEINRKYGYNIKRCSSASEMDVDMATYYKRYKYLFQCQKCNHIIGKSKVCGIVREPHKFVHRNCGGSFVAIDYNTAKKCI